MMTGEQIRNYRKEAGLSQTQLAEELTDALGVTYTTSLVSYIENGAVLPSEQVVRYISSKMPEKPFRNRSDEVLEQEWTTTSTDAISSLKSAVLEKRRITQEDRVLEYIKDFGSISSWEAFIELGITRLSAVIFNLAKDGHRIERKTENVTNRYGTPVHYTRYSLGKDDGKEDLD